MDKELQASGRCLLAHYLYTPLLYLRRLRYLQLKSASKGFWMFLEVLSSCIRGTKTLNKLKNTRKTQFFHLKKSFVLLFFVILQPDNGMVAKPLIRILRIHVDVSCISKRWFGVFFARPFFWVRLVKSQSESVKPVPRIFLFTLTWDAFRWRCVFFAMLFSSRFLNKIKCLAIGKCFENYIYGGTGQGW